jgi:type I restriction enzyme S subunit
MSKYETYKRTDVEWVDTVPEHWQVTKLKLLGNFTSSGIDKLILEDEGSVKMVNYMDVYGNKDSIINSSFDFMVVTCPDSKKQVHNVIKGDLIFTPSSETIEDIGLSALIDEDLDNTVYSYHVLRFRFAKKIEHKFKKYLCNNFYVLSQFSSNAKGTTRQILSREEFKNTVVFIPTPAEQLTIANYLDLQTQKIDCLIANKKAQAEKLKELRQIEINNSVTKGLNPNAELKDSGIDWLGEIPKHWELKHLKRAFNFYNNIRIPLSSEERADLENIYDYYGASGVIDKVDRYLFDGDYILIGEDGANLLDRNSPLAFKASGKFWVNNHAHIIKPIKGDIDFYTFFLESIDFTVYITGSAQPKLTIEALSGVRVVVPPIQEQIQIAEYLKERTKAIDTLMKNVQTQIEKLQELRKIKIYEAVTGKIKVNAYVEATA